MDQPERTDDQWPNEEPANRAKPFSPGFLWGAATSAYQIEGGITAGGRGPSIWDDFVAQPGAIRDGHTGAQACDHYHRWPQDLDLAADIGLGAYRFSLSWSRLQPSGEGPLNPAGVTFYRNLLTGLSDRGIRPFVTLYHWDLPSPLERSGGWPNRQTAVLFSIYARLAAEAFGDLVTDWVTINEPWCSSFLGYYSGDHAPGRQNLPDAVAAAHHLNLAHGLAVRQIRGVWGSELKVGISTLVTEVLAASDKPDDVAAAGRVDTNANLMFLSPVYHGEYASSVYDLYQGHGLRQIIQHGDLDIISVPTDFAGVNHYHRHIVSADPNDPHLGALVEHAQPAPTTLGWSLAPSSLRNILKRVSSEFTQMPMYVTENGAAYTDSIGPDRGINDHERVDYLKAYIEAVGEAISDGADVRGYFAWSLLDNFEWGEGYAARFGLIYVDYETQERLPKASAKWYRSHIEAQSELQKLAEPHSDRPSFTTPGRN